jgi:hypothetical protein
VARKSTNSVRIHHSRLAPPGADDDDIGLAAFERAEARIVQHCRESLVRTLKVYSRGSEADPVRLAAITITGLFADMIGAVPGRTDLLDAINRAIEPAGLRLVPRE